jgi:hypothetical protein
MQKLNKNVTCNFLYFLYRQVADSRIRRMEPEERSIHKISSSSAYSYQIQDINVTSARRPSSEGSDSSVISSSVITLCTIYGLEL